MGKAANIEDAQGLDCGGSQSRAKGAKCQILYCALTAKVSDECIFGQYFAISLDLKGILFLPFFGSNTKMLVILK